MFSGWANGHRSSAALEAVYRIYAHPETRLRPEGAAGTDTGRDPGAGEAQDRQSRMTCALRHLGDGIAGLSFTQVVFAADADYIGQSSRESPGQIAGRAAMAARAIEVYDRQVTTPLAAARGRSQATAGGPEPDCPGARPHLRGAHHAPGHRAAERPAPLLRPARCRVLGRHDRGIPGVRRAAPRRRRPVPDRAGHQPQSRVADPFPRCSAAFELIATRQGIVTTFADAEWHLVRTAARIDYQAGNAPEYPNHRDEDDLIALSRGLGRTCGLPAGEVVGQLTPRIEARITEIEQGPDTAADLGREHARAGTPPYCDLDIDGDATALMHASGETEPMTDANHPHRLALVTAYAQAYRQASGHGLAAAVSPARLAGQSFPRQPGPPAPPGSAPAVPGAPASQARARPGTRPRNGPAR